MTSMEVCEAIGGVIAGLWPDRLLYRDFCPVDFQRPGGFLHVTGSGMEPVNTGLVAWTMKAQLELFCATDAYDVSSTEALRRDQEAVLLAFAAPKLQVGGRWVEVTAQGNGMEIGSAFVNFTARWTDQRPGYHDPEDMADPETAAAPRMERYEISRETRRT